uniref:Transcriptional repressor n=1 Tax=candidate division CPR3 bacterium TaxID=2268181 RepID=A0A7C4QX01_UNCC3
MAPIERLTNQKKAILDYLRSTAYHPDAYEVYEIVKKKLPQISLATVYRNLDSMAKKGLIKEIRIKPDRFNYDGIEKKHHHFKCLECGSTFNIDDDILLNFEKVNESGIVGLVDDYEVILSGICLNCQRKKK